MNIENLNKLKNIKNSEKLLETIENQYGNQTIYAKLFFNPTYLDFIVMNKNLLVECVNNNTSYINSNFYVKKDNIMYYLERKQIQFAKILFMFNIFNEK